jgi:hypothetical protein
MDFARVEGFHLQEKPLDILKLEASSREAGQDSGINRWGRYMRSRCCRWS